MKILVSFEDRVRPDSTGIYIREAFKYLGHEVTHVLPDKIMKVEDGYDLYVKVDDGQKVTQWNPRLHPSHYYCIDTHIETDWRISLAKWGDFDSVSVVHFQGLDLDWGRKDVQWLPVGCDPEFHNVGKREKIYDGCFIGNFHNGLSGPRVDALDVFFKSCPGPIFHGMRTFKEMTEKYAQSKLVFNRGINSEGGEGPNMRVFEALCSGSCLVTDRVKDMDKLGLEDGVHFAGYSSHEELESVVKELLSNDEKREKIARQGQEEVMKNHKYQDRMSKLMDYLHTKELTNGLIKC